MTAPSPANRAALPMSSDTTTTGDVSLLIARADNQLQSFEKLSFRLSQELLALVSALVAERDGLRARDGALFDAIDQIAAERRDVVDNHQTVKNASRANSNGEVAYFSGKSAGLQVALDILAETLPAPVSSRSQSGDETPGGEGTERHDE
jgi:hypothetical protein